MFAIKYIQISIFEFSLQISRDWKNDTCYWVDGSMQIKQMPWPNF
jgi:hypothetical protein